jgi:hypothetical protein
MSKNYRPKIPAEMTREILVEAGHRCSVCGDPCPLERAHIIPWRVAKEHRAENLICLCASCHERADLEDWGEKTLRVYKGRPWILRKRGPLVESEPTRRVTLTLDMEFESFDEKRQRLLLHALAGFLDISPDAIKIRSTDPGSVRVELELPARSARKLLDAAQTRDSTLEHFLPFELLRAEEDRRKPDLQVFFCHAREDRPHVRRIAEWLRLSGVEPWMDEERILPGQDWEAEIRRNIGQSRVFLCFLSRHTSRKRGFVQREMQQALEVVDERAPGQAIVIPVKLEECDVPAALRRFHWVDAFDEDDFEKLERTLRDRAKGLVVRTER